MRNQQKISDEIVKPLLQWYDKNSRVLPWRINSEPYHVWLSEIMLQQTRVETVKPYYKRFLKNFPTIQSLAIASEEHLLKLWQGLGYYSRIRTMQKAAHIVVEQYHGNLPASFEKLRSLPGFGDYTAGAVSSIAFNIPVPAVDGNVLRVFSRIQACSDDILNSKIRAAITKQIASIIPKDRAGDFNQSLMELGATICVPNGVPKCSLCPIAALCKANQQGIAQSLPKKAAKPPRKREEYTIFLLICNQKIALRKRPERGLLASLWEFPNTVGKLTEPQAKVFLKQWGVIENSIILLKPAKHVFTHIEWIMSGYFAVLSDFTNMSDIVWASIEDMHNKYPLPSAFRAYEKQIPSFLNNVNLF